MLKNTRQQCTISRTHSTLIISVSIETSHQYHQHLQVLKIISTISHYELPIHLSSNRSSCGRQETAQIVFVIRAVTYRKTTLKARFIMGINYTACFAIPSRFQMFLLRYLTSGGSLHLSSPKGVTQKRDIFTFEKMASLVVSSSQMEKRYAPYSSKIQTCNTALPHSYSSLA